MKQSYNVVIAELNTGYPYDKWNVKKPRFVVAGRLLLLLVQSRQYASSLITVNHPSEVNKTVPVAPFVSTLGQKPLQKNPLKHIITDESLRVMSETDRQWCYIFCPVWSDCEGTISVSVKPDIVVSWGFMPLICFIHDRSASLGSKWLEHA